MIALVPYSAGWPVEFRRLAERLRGRLGASAIRIDHIGSTSVPGLCAKDVLDVQVSVQSIDPHIGEQVAALGFRAPDGVWSDHRPPDASGPVADWQKLFFHEPIGERRVNLHVRAIGKPNQLYPLLCRDFLIAHPPIAAAYGELKRRLAAAVSDADDYTDVKDPAVDLIYLAALKWAELLPWQPGASDA
jgi:GrpB-like predicted nucleotidyltransferase (UPF0157 family)